MIHNLTAYETNLLSKIRPYGLTWIRKRSFRCCTYSS